MAAAEPVLEAPGRRGVRRRGEQQSSSPPAPRVSAWWRSRAAPSIRIGAGRTGAPMVVGAVVAALAVGDPDSRSRRCSPLCAPLTQWPRASARQGGLAGNPTAVVVIIAAGAGDPLAGVVVVAAGGGGNPESAAIVVAIGRRLVRRRHPAAAAVVVAVRRAIDPDAVAIVVAARVDPIDSVGVPLIVLIVVAVSVGAVGVGAGRLVADHRPADAADHGAGAAIAAWRHRAADQRADTGAGDRADHLMVALLRARLCRRQRGNQRGRGKAGHEK